MIIDSTKPQIRIEGVEDGSANSSDFRVRAQCQDPYYLPGSLNAEIQADFGGVKPASGLREDDKGAVLTFDSFPRRKGADAIYHLSVTAKDRAGNVSKKRISFSVNRYGSSYSLSDETARELKQYYHRKPFAVTFIETNLDQVGSARVLLRSGDSLTELGAGSGLEVSESRTSNGASRYSYTVPASCFSKDGIYEVMLLTSDRAGNSSDSAAQRLPVRFAIDAAAPECLVSGIRPEGKYQGEQITAVIEVRDNIALDRAQIYVDSSKTDEWDEERLQKTGGVIKLTLHEKEAWQTVQVHVIDQAGNQFWTKEIPVYVSSKDPEKAEKYQSTRLSAQQIELLKVVGITSKGR